MAVSVTLKELKCLLRLAEDDDQDLGLYIRAAQTVVTEDLKDTSYSDERKTEIALFLAAHFAEVSVSQGGLVSKKVGETEETYRVTKSTSTNDHAYKATRFGLQALTLDSEGILIQTSTQLKPALFRVVGSK